MRKTDQNQANKYGASSDLYTETGRGSEHLSNRQLAASKTEQCLSCEWGLKTCNTAAFWDSHGSCEDPQACLHVPCLLFSCRFMQMTDPHGPSPNKSLRLYPCILT